MKDRLLIIGGFGFVGSNLIDNLFNEFDIFVLVPNHNKKVNKRINSNKIIRLNKNFELNSNGKSIIGSMDYVINLAALVKSDDQPELMSVMIETHITFVAKLINLFRFSKNLKLFINMGSMEEYGDIEGPFKENQICSPVTPYGLTKLMSSQLVMYYHLSINFPVTVLRVGNLFGDYQKDSYFIPKLINAAKKTETLVIKSGNQVRDFLYIKDFIYLLLRVIKFKDKFIGEIVNVSSGQGVRIEEIAKIVKSELNSKVNFQFLESKHELKVLCNDKFLQLTESRIEVETVTSIKNFLNQFSN